MTQVSCCAKRNDASDWGSILGGGASSEVSPLAGNAATGGSPAGPMGGTLIEDRSPGLDEMTLPGGETETTAGRMPTKWVRLRHWTKRKAGLLHNGRWG